MKELIPTGKLRVGVAFAPKMSALFVIKDASGNPQGITADLGNALAQQLGVPVEFMVAPNTGVLTDALASAAIDVAFMPVDEERRKRLDFGPAYCMVESTYLVTGPSGLKTLADVDQPHVRVVGIANTTTIRAVRPHAEEHAADRRDLDRRRGGDAARWQGRCLRARARFAAGFSARLSRLAHRRRRLPADRHRHRGIAGCQGKPQALAYVTAFMNEAKASGLVRRAMDRAGMKDWRWRRSSPSFRLPKARTRMR